MNGTGTWQENASPTALTRLSRWLLVGLLACLPFVAGLLAALLGPAELRTSLHPWLACLILLLGVPLWFVVAEALASAISQAIKPRTLFVVVDALCGYGLLVLLFSMLVRPWWGAASCAAATAIVWWVTAPATFRWFRRANGRPEGRTIPE